MADAPITREELAVKHAYVSTACQHGLHDRCRKVCKFCEAGCLCQCHQLSQQPEDA